MEYPPCPKRVVGTVKGVVTHAKCLDQSNTRYMGLVQPAECERCLAGAPEPAPAEPAPPEPPGLVRRAISYAEALAQWTAAGRPERSDKDVEHIFSRFCKCCRWYDRRKNICKGCGCRVADSGYAIRNKIKMATERCPKNLW
jgi:hypothetical protein